MDDQLTWEPGAPSWRRAFAGTVVALMLLVALEPLAELLPSFADRVTPGRGAEAAAAEDYASLPVAFEPNVGQAAGGVDFLARLGGATLYLTARGAHVVPADGRAARVWFPGASEDARVVGRDQLPGVSNYFVGNDPQKWHTAIPTFESVVYKGVYPGIDVVYHGVAGELEYDFVVHPGADTNDIAIRVGKAPLHVSANGALVARVGNDRLVQQPPQAFQRVSGMRSSIDSRYVLLTRDRAGFEVGSFNRRLPLVIDPVLVYSTYLGGSDTDSAFDITVDSLGAAYVAGETLSTNFPDPFPPKQNPSQGGLDAFVAKLNPEGSALLYSTHIGGTGNESALAITIDSDKAAYVAGETASGDFPTWPANSPQKTIGGKLDAFVAKLDSGGSSLIYSSFLGGFDDDSARGIALDASNALFVTGRTDSANFPTAPANPLQPAHGGWRDAFVTKVNPTGTALSYSTFLGGPGFDYANAIAVRSGVVHIAGESLTSVFPTVSAYQSTNHGGYDAFIATINQSGTELTYSTYFGGESDDYALGIALDSTGVVYFAGYTGSKGLATSAALQKQHAGGNYDAFVAKLDLSSNTLVYFTYLGGSGVFDVVNGLAVDTAGAAYVGGYTNSTDFPTKNAFQLAYGGSNADGMVAKLNPAGSELVYASYLGGRHFEQVAGIALDSEGAAYLAGFTEGGHGEFSTFPTERPLQPFGGGGYYDGFVTKVGPSSTSPTPSPTSSPSPSPTPPPSSPPPTTSPPATTIPSPLPPECLDADVILGTADHDILSGTPGDDVICGLDGNDTLSGNGGDDVLYGQAGNDTLLGHEGSDSLEGDGGNDTLRAHAGNDYLDGAGGNDTLSGFPGNDYMDSGAANDTLSGEAGEDILLGRAGNDRLDGGVGTDMCNGGAHANQLSSCNP